MPITCRTIGSDAGDAEVDELYRQIAELKKLIAALGGGTVQSKPTTIQQAGQMIVAKVGGDPSFLADGVEFGEGFLVSEDAAHGLGQIEYVPPPGVSSLIIGNPVQDGTAGSVLFIDAAGNLAQDNADFYWDTTNRSLKIICLNSVNFKPIEAQELTTDQTTSLSLVRATRVSTGAISSSFGTGISVELGESSGAAVQAAAFAGEYDGGSGTADCRAVLIARSGGTVFAHSHFKSDGSLSMQKIGGGLNLKEGTNARHGVATLVAGTVTVTTTKVTANSRIATDRQAAGGVLGNLGQLAIANVVVGTSFDIVSSNILDASTIYWQIFEPS